MVFVISGRTTGMVIPVFVASSFWKWIVSDSHRSDDRTHVKDPKDIFEVRPPSGDRLFIFLRVEVSRDRIPFAPLDQLPLNICYRPAIETILVDGSGSMSLVPLTPLIHLSHHTQTDSGHPFSFHSSPGQALGRRRHKLSQARYNPVYQLLRPCRV